MKHRFGIKGLLSLALAGAMLLSPTLAAGAEEKFPAKNTYPGYADVQESDWFYPNARLCYEVGLMTGTDVGFEPNKVLTEAECVTLAARVGATLRGESIRPAQEGEPWWEPYREYRFPYGGGEGGSAPATRWSFLFMLYFYAYESGLLEPVNDVKALPDSDDAMVLDYYNAGILTGLDSYGTFAGGKSLTRAEAAAMVSRLVRPELRLSFTPADYSPFTAAHLTPDTRMFHNSGVTADVFLSVVNEAIIKIEETTKLNGTEFNWHDTLSGTDKTCLEWLKAEVLNNCAVTAKDGTQAYKDFDVQVYYSRLIDLRGGRPLERIGAPRAATTAPREYTLTEIALPEGWTPPEGDYSAADGWVAIERQEDGRRAEQAVYRASDGAVLSLDGYSVFTADSPTSMENVTRFLVRRFDAQRDGLLFNVFDIEEGRLLLDTPVLDTDNEDWKARIAPCFPKSDRPHHTRDEATGLYGYQDEAGNWAVPARYYEMWYLGDGVFTYWGEEDTCGTVTLDGVETPTETFKGCINGGLFANYGVIATGRLRGWKPVMNYYDYAGNQISEDFDWAGPIGDDGAGFVGKDGKLFRIQF